MTRKRKVVLAGAVTGALVVGLGAAGAVAATTILSPKQESQAIIDDAASQTTILSPKQESQAIIDDAASQLGVQPSALSRALKQALKNRVDAAVDAGLLTKEQAAEMKARIDSEDFPLLGPGRGHGPDFGHRPLGHHHALSAAASYLGLTEAELRAELDGTTSLADLAKKKGKPVDGLVTAMVNAAEQEIDKAVADGRLTKEQATAVKADLKQHLERLVNARPDRDGLDGHPGFGFRSDGPRGPPDFDGPPV